MCVLCRLGELVLVVVLDGVHLKACGPGERDAEGFRETWKETWRYVGA